MHEIVIPQLNSNDDSCVLREWLFVGGDRVETGDIVAIVETSKAIAELDSDASGIFEPAAGLDSECAFGSVIAYVFDSENERLSFLAADRHSDHGDAQVLTITKAAEELIERHSVSASELKTLGKKTVKTSDVERLLARSGETAPPGLNLSRRQAAIADSVSLSHQTIPKAFLLMKIYCDHAQEYLSRFIEKEHVVAGLPELLVLAVSRLCIRYPAFYRNALDDGIAPPENANVGVTVDVGTGLFVPVIQETGSKNLTEIARTLMRFRVSAMRERFSEDDLSGGHITISLNTAPDVVLVVPVILPGQTCMLSLGSIQEELSLDGDGTPVVRTYCHLGVAYDHRVINGYDAVQFVAEIKRDFETEEMNLKFGGAGGIRLGP